MCTARLSIGQKPTMLFQQLRKSGHYCLDEMVPDAHRKIRTVTRQRTKGIVSYSMKKFAVPVRWRQIVLTDCCRSTDWLIYFIPNKPRTTLMKKVRYTSRRITWDRLHERQLNSGDTWDHSASYITSSRTSFYTRVSNEMSKKSQLTTIQFVKRIQNNVEDDVMRDAKCSRVSLKVHALSVLATWGPILK